MALEIMLVPRMEPKAIRHSGLPQGEYSRFYFSGSEGFGGFGAAGFGGLFFA